MDIKNLDIIYYERKFMMCKNVCFILFTGKS